MKKKQMADRWSAREVNHGAEAGARDGEVGYLWINPSARNI